MPRQNSGLRPPEMDEDMTEKNLAPERIVLSPESVALVDDALALVFEHGPVYAMKWLASRMEQQTLARLQESAQSRAPSTSEGSPA